MSGRAHGIKTRLLDVGQVSVARSQTTYHAVAACAAPDDPPTLCLLRPDRPYVSIGYHQEASKEIDLPYCHDHHIPVLRRMVGGGAVLLDQDQLFFHLIIPSAQLSALKLPLRFAERYPRLAQPAIAAYRTLGIPAAFRPVNDIHVHGRKIGGTGTADIGEAFVFVGSMMLDFNHALMARVLRFADEKMRDTVHRSMQEYVTSLTHESGTKPPLETVREALLAGFREQLHLDCAPGHLSSQEQHKVEELDQLFLSPAWLHRIAWQGQRTRKLAINCAVGFLEAEHQSAGRLLRMAVRVVDGKVDELFLSGDSSFLPGHAVEHLRRAFLGVPLTATDWHERITQTWQTQPFATLDLQAEDFSALTRKIMQVANP